MDYPKCNHYLVFKRIGRDKYNIKNVLTDEEWETSEFYVRFLKALDGNTDPFEICSEQMSEEEMDSILKDMKEEGFLDNFEGVKLLGIGSILIPLWHPKVTKAHRIFGAIWNKILMICWLPLLMLGAYVLFSFNWEWVDRGHGLLIGYLFGLVLGMVLHEFSHAFACIGYSSKNHFFEMGVMAECFLPGAYVMIDYSDMKNRFKRAQISAAGVECNLALCGLFLCCLKMGIFDSMALIIAAFLNLILAVFNSTLIDGIDGMGIFTAVFTGSEDFLKRAKKLIKSSKCKRKLYRRGINGKATIAACYIIVWMQVLFPLILVMNAVAFAGLFFM